MHPLMFTGNVNENTYEFVEAHGGKGVTLTYYSEFTIKNKGLLPFSHRLIDELNSQELLDSVINFATADERLDDEFIPLVYFDDDLNYYYHKKNHNPNDPNDPLSDKWYCTELIWAAYKNHGIELDQNDGPILPIDFHICSLLKRINIY